MPVVRSGWPGAVVEIQYRGLLGETIQGWVRCRQRPEPTGESDLAVCIYESCADPCSLSGVVVADAAGSGDAAPVDAEDGGPEPDATTSDASMPPEASPSDATSPDVGPPDASLDAVAD